MDSGFKVAVVVPTIREASIQAFLSAWRDEFEGHLVVIVEDNPERTFDVAGRNHEHYAWKDIDKDLGRDAWIIPRRTDCIRSYGYLKAFQKKVDVIVTLDDDCYPTEGSSDFLKTHWARLNEEGESEAWVSTVEGALPRGVPYYARTRRRPCVLNHGLWTSVPDFDAPTQLIHSRHPLTLTHVDQTIPLGRYYPMCGMNLAFRPNVVPAMYSLLMGRDYAYDRFGDIWSGIILKRIVDHLGYCVHSGRPAIMHLRASSVWDNLKKEAPGLEVNEVLWQVVDRVHLKGSTFRECYKEVAAGLRLEGNYWEKLRQAMLVWADLFSD